MRKIYFTGTGPGDPELLTRKAVRVIGDADVIFVPANKGKNMALDTIREFVEDKNIEFLNFPMGKVNGDDYKKAADRISELVPENGTGVFVTIGDPMIYSTAVYIMDRIQKDNMEVEVVSGIPSFVAAAGNSLVPLVTKGEIFCLSDTFNEDNLEWADSLAILKTNGKKEEILESIEKKDFSYTYIRETTLPGEYITREKRAILEDKAYISMILARKERTDIRWQDLTKNKY